MKKEMRIVGLSNSINLIFVQNRIGRNWEQTRMSIEDFAEMMKAEFPKYWDEFQRSERKDIGDYFYSYGEDESNDTYIFEN